MDEKLDPSQDEALNHAVGRGISHSKKLLAGGLAAVAAAGGIAYGLQDNGPEHPRTAHTAEPFPDTSGSTPVPEATQTTLPPAPALVSPTETAPATPRQSIVASAPSSHETTTPPPPNTSPTPEARETDWGAKLYTFGNDVAANIEKMKGSPDWRESTGTNGSFPGSTLETFTRAAQVSNNPDYDGEYRFEVTRDKQGGLLDVALKEVATSKSQGRQVVLRNVNITTETTDGHVNRLGYITTYTGSSFPTQAYIPKGVEPQRPADRIVVLTESTLQQYENSMDQVGEDAASNPPHPLTFPKSS